MWPGGTARSRANAAAAVRDAAPKSGKEWVAPKVAWGDPDISGNFTNIDEVATPLERPAQLAGRRLEDITGRSSRSFGIRRSSP